MKTWNAKLYRNQDAANSLNDITMEQDDQRLDDKTRSYLSENFSFFDKRQLIQNAVLKIEKIMFYNNNIKPSIEDSGSIPDLIAYHRKDSQLENYKYASFPALSLSTALDSKVLESRDEIDELQFVKFMRDFTKKAFLKARELNKSFHHQYKHTLAELGFQADEKLFQLKTELELLETPEHKEEAYKQLLDKITALFHEHLKEKEQSISNLKGEEEKVQNEIDANKKSLEKLLDTTIEDSELEQIVNNMPDHLESIKREILTLHKKKLNEVSPVFNSYYKLHVAAANYFQKVLNYAILFQKALWMHRYQKMFELVKKDSETWFSLDPLRLEEKIKKLEGSKNIKNKNETTQVDINQYARKLKETLETLRKIPAKGLFQVPKTEKDKLKEYLEYYANESKRLTSLTGKLKQIYHELNTIQNSLFKKQERADWRQN